MRRVLWPALTALSLLASPAAADERGRARALELFEQSAQAYREGRFQEAVDLLLEARRLEHEPVLLYDLARAYEALGKPAEAADAYEAYLAEEPQARDRGAIEGRIGTLRAQAEQLAKAQAAAPAPANTEAPPRAPEGEPESATPWVITGLGLAGVGAGVALGLVAEGRHDDAVADPVQTSAARKQEAAESFATAAKIALIAGGTAVGIGLAWLGLRVMSPSRPIHLTPGPASLLLRGSF